MDSFKELADRLRAINAQQGYIYQGIVKSVEDILCTVTIGCLDVEGVRLRASESADDESQMLVVPAIGSAVIIGSLSGDFNDLAVLSVDKIDRIIINGGQLGGLIKINELTKKLNELVSKFNSHTHDVATTGTSSAQKGTAAATTNTAASFNASDYEDDKITH